jgi:hypothetical protein
VHVRSVNFYAALLFTFNMAFFRTMSRWTRKRKTDCELKQLMRDIGETPQTYTLDCSTAADLTSTCTNKPEINDDCDSTGESSCSDSDVDEPSFDYDSDSSAYLANAMNFSSSESDDKSECFTDSIKDDLADWAVQYGIAHVAITALLSILRKMYPRLPKDSRSLFNRSNYTDLVTEQIACGSYCHFGIENGVIPVITEWQLQNTEPVQLHVNIDGLPLFRSTNDQFWPILGHLSNCRTSDPFVIGIFHGKSKPNDAIPYLKRFIDEFRKLQETGIVCNGKRFDIELSAVICDTPARAFVRSVKGHSGYFGCDKCEQEGNYINGRVVFPETDSNLRSDASFRLQLNEEHHLGHSPFCELPIDMIAVFPLDYMHLVCLGVMRKLLYIWTKGPVKTGARLGRQYVNKLSEALLVLEAQVPVDFGCKPRSLNELERWKATELRQFLLYTGMICLRGVVAEAVHNNFLLLSVSMYILLSPCLCQKYSDYAGELLKAFVTHFGKLYGVHFMSYNVHAAIHLATEIKFHGALDNVSSFIFENHLRKLKKLIRKPQAPLQQVARRLCEGQLSVKTEAVQILQKEHHEGPVLEQFIMCKQYKEYRCESYTIKTKPNDNCVLLHNSVVLVRNFVSVDSASYVIFQKFKSSKPYYSYPLDSTKLDIYSVSHLGTKLEFALLTELGKKCVLLSLNGETVAVPLLHSDA